MTSPERHSVLIVEDERIVAKDLQQTLQGLGYDAFAIAATAEEALLRASERCPDVVLMDIRIKGERDGIEVAQILRESFGIPVVYLTAHADEGTVERAMRTAPYGYLVKPVQLAELRGALEVAIFRHKFEQELRDQGLRSEAALRSMADAVVTLDSAGNVTFMNLAAEALVGAHLEDVIGKPAGEVVQLLDVPLIGPPGGEPDVEPREATLVNVESGARRLVKRSVSPLSSADAALGAVLVFRDVTQEKQVQKQLALSDQLPSIAALAVGVAHQINSPLAVVLNNAAFVAEDLARGKQVALESALEALADLQAAADKIAQTVSDLLELTSPRPLGEQDLTDPVRCVQSALRAMTRELGGRARFITRFDPVAPVRADPSRLRQAFVHLLRNALHALAVDQAARNQVTLTTSTDQQGFIVVEIADNGPGIPKEALARIFDPFFTTDVAGSLGLGLSICRGIISSLGGRIEIESEAGRTAAIVRLPPAPSPPKAGVKTTEAGLAQGRRRILVVDDDPLVLKVLARLLRAYDVVCLESARDALARIERGERFDLILSDVTMPEVTGIEFYETLLSRDPDLARRVTFISGGAGSSEMDAFLRAVPNLLIRKPFDAGLKQTVERLLSEVD